MCNYNEPDFEDDGYAAYNGFMKKYKRQGNIAIYSVTLPGLVTYYKALCNYFTEITYG